MTKPIPCDPMYRQRAFDAEVIQLCVRWYITYRPHRTFVAKSVVLRIFRCVTF